MYNSRETALTWAIKWQTLSLSADCFLPAALLISMQRSAKSVRKFADQRSELMNYPQPRNCYFVRRCALRSRRDCGNQVTFYVRRINYGFIFAPSRRYAPIGTYFHVINLRSMPGAVPIEIRAR